jgi:hypothetical protein
MSAFFTQERVKICENSITLSVGFFFFLFLCDVWEMLENAVLKPGGKRVRNSGNQNR